MESWSPSATPARGYPTTSPPGFSTPSSPRRSQGREPAWAWPPCIPSWPATGDNSTSTPVPTAPRSGPDSPCISRPRRQPETHQIDSPNRLRHRRAVQYLPDPLDRDFMCDPAQPPGHRLRSEHGIHDRLFGGVGNRVDQRVHRLVGQRVDLTQPARPLFQVVAGRKGEEQVPARIVTVTPGAGQADGGPPRQPLALDRQQRERRWR